MNDLKDSQNKNSNEINKLNENYRNLLDKINALDQFTKNMVRKYYSNRNLSFWWNSFK